MEHLVAEPAQKQETKRKEKVNILLVDDQPAKLLTYEAILGELDENLFQATSGRDALDKLLKIKDVAVILMDVSMPGMDGFETARLIREHPRFQRTAIIFISAIHLTDLDRVKGYERGAVDYISVPVNPELLRAKVTVFADLHRATRQLEELNRELEERVRARTLELQESEAQFRAVANSIPQLAWMADPDGSIIWHSDRWYEYTGVSKADADSDAWKNRVDPGSRDCILEIWGESIARGEPFEMEFRLRGADGVYRWFLTQAMPLRDSNGAIKHWFGARTNIHEQREIRRALEQAQERLLLAQKASHCGTFDYDVSTGVNFWSDELQRIYGFLPRLFPGTYQAWLDCVLPEDRAAAEEPFRSKDKEFETEFRIHRRDDGEVRWINSRGRIHRDPQGNIARVVGLHIDITRTKRAEEDLKRAHDELETRVLKRTAALRIAEDRLRRLSGRLMQSQDDERRRIARELHDSLGQYLVASKMSLDLASMNSSTSSDRIKECLADAINQIERAISETRTISHLLHPPLLDEVGLESALVWYAEGFAKRSGIAVEVDIAPSIGRLATDIETAVFRVVQECLTNVHRHSGSQTASVKLYRADGDLRLEVRDEGRGMPTASLAAEGQSALGVGLQGIRERLLQLHGSLEIISGDGKGTTVIAMIPGVHVSGAARESGTPQQGRSAEISSQS